MLISYISDEGTHINVLCYTIFGYKDTRSPSLFDVTHNHLSMRGMLFI